MRFRHFYLPDEIAHHQQLRALDFTRELSGKGSQPGLVGAGSQERRAVVELRDCLQQIGENLGVIGFGRENRLNPDAFGAVIQVGVAEQLAFRMVKHQSECRFAREWFDRL